MNGSRKSFAELIIIGADSLLIMLSVWTGIHLRFWGNGAYVFEGDYLIPRIVLIALVVQLMFYYFDLYSPRIFRERKATGVLILESLGASSIFLAVIYYLVPLLTVGRGIFAISLFMIFVCTFVWRLCFTWVLQTRTFKERVLIVGTGELARKIRKELIENGHDGFEIVGFIDETRDKIGKRI
jgi:FlaA1/EpsC-like NDP-sugar epimerase